MWDRLADGKRNLDRSTTTEYTLTVIAYHLIKHSEIREKLQDELRGAQKASIMPLEWAQLEQLPYLVSLFPFTHI